VQAPRVIAVGGGKGGTGKSLLATNIAIYLTTLGNRVVVLDAALGGANAHVLCGGVRPHRTLAEVLTEDGVHLVEITEDTTVPGLQLISGRRDPVWAANPDPEQIARLAGEVRQLEADWVVIDIGPGTGADQLELFLTADAGVVVAVPEPTSVELAWRFIRSAFLRRLARAGLADAGRIPAHELRGDSGIPAPLDIYERALGRDDGTADALRDQISRFAPQLVVNFARSKAEMDLGHAMVSAGHRRLGLPIGYLGHVEYDEAVWVALRRARPLLIDHPETRVAKCIEKITRRLMGWIPEPMPELVGREETYYELLEVAPTSTFEDIRRANRRIRENYGPESVVVGGLYSRERLEALHRRFDEAYGVLMDAGRRKEYDQRLFPEGMPSSSILGESAPQVLGAGGPPRALPPMPTLTSETEFSGAMLRQIREAKGIELREIAERSKVGMTYLQAIEDENWSKLPAVVYTRGFLVEYAKAAGLDPNRVADSFLDRLRKHRKPTNA
jgi:flagellar biosynthesis protein FlhG